MRGEEWSYYWWVGYVNVVVSLVLELLFLSQTLKTASITDTAQVLFGYIQTLEKLYIIMDLTNSLDLLNSFYF